MSPRLSVVIPAYNEAARILPSLEKIRRFLEEERIDAEVFVVDDGSNDGTAELVRQQGPANMGSVSLSLLQNPRNRGKGYSVRRGVLESRGEQVLFTDSDLSCPIEEYRKLCDALTRRTAQIAFGSRALAASRVELHQNPVRELSGRTFNLLVRALAGLPFRDTQCGFKLFTRRAAHALFALQTIDGFGFDVEILYIARKLGYRTIEVPVIWRNSADSRVRLSSGALAFADVLRIRMQDLRGKYDGAKPDEDG